MSGRLLCVGTATSLDRYAWVESLALGEVNRPSRVLERAGGKSLNVTRAALALGVDVRAVAMADSPSIERLDRLARAEGLPVLWIEGGGPVRQCLCVLDESRHVVTEIYEPLVPATGRSGGGQRVLDRVRAELDGGMVAAVAFSGRVGPGQPTTVARHVVEIAREHRVLSIVDSDADVLAQALVAAPDVVKVNRAEAARALGQVVETPPDELAPALVDAGAGIAIVTDGADGAVAASDRDVRRRASPPIPHAMPVGSGDSFVAGLVAGLLERGQLGTLEQMLRDGTAAASVNARSFLAGSVDPAAWARERSG